jgi:nucleoside-diphosphate-sugar epimerase
MEPSIKDLSILVSGAGGFIGPAVVQALVNEGAAVHALVGPPGQHPGSLPASVQVHESDIADTSNLCHMMQGCSMVVHLAGGASVTESLEDPVEYARVHVAGTAAVLEACRSTGISRLVYLSSAEVYGRPLSNPVTEKHAVQPRSPYGAAKAGAEQFVEAFVRSGIMSAIILRPFSIYGMGASKRSLLVRILNSVNEKDGIVLADLAPVRDYCYLDDLVEAILLACRADLSGCNVVNVGTGKGTSVKELAELVMEILGRPVLIREDPMLKRPAQIEIRELVADPTRARELLGWRPRTTLREGLERILGVLVS